MSMEDYVWVFENRFDETLSAYATKDSLITFLKETYEGCYVFELENRIQLFESEDDYYNGCEPIGDAIKLVRR